MVLNTRERETPEQWRASGVPSLATPGRPEGDGSAGASGRGRILLRRTAGGSTVTDSDLPFVLLCTLIADGSGKGDNRPQQDIPLIAVKVSSARKTGPLPQCDEGLGRGRNHVGTY